MSLSSVCLSQHPCPSHSRPLDCIVIRLQLLVNSVVCLSYTPSALSFSTFICRISRTFVSSRHCPHVRSKVRMSAHVSVCSSLSCVYSMCTPAYTACAHLRVQHVHTCVYIMCTPAYTACAHLRVQHVYTCVYSICTHSFA